MNKKKLYPIITVFAVITLASGLLITLGSENFTGKNQKRAETIRKAAPDFNLRNQPDYPKPVKEYFTFYNIDFENQFENLTHHFGFFSSQDINLAAHLYCQKDSNDLVIIMHGYTNHCGSLGNLIKDLIENNFSVACFDLPGHGLSDGKQGYIDDFSTYTKCLNDFIKILKQKGKKNIHLVGHSTGSAIILEKITSDNNYQKQKISKVVLLAPLIRSWMWTPSKIIFSITSLWSDSVKRVPRKISGDKEYLHFLNNKDFLVVTKVPNQWINAMYRWNENFEKINKIEKQILVIQGNKDKVVEWKHNIRFLSKTVTDCKTVIIKDARHELINESKKIRENVIQNVTSWLKKK